MRGSNGPDVKRFPAESPHVAPQVRGAVYMAYLTSWGPLLILPILYLLTQHIERGMQVSPACPPPPLTPLHTRIG